MKRISKDRYYLDIALAVSKRSTCLKRHYGCVLVKDDTIIATGYNGSPRGDKNCCDKGVCKRSGAQRYSGYEDCPAVHAEQNALLATDRAHTQGATLYLACEELEGDLYHEDITPLPCSICRNMMCNAGIARFVNRLILLEGEDGAN